ncbi:DNA-binding transcriptional LysR family regulator [Oxalobacteraceae bacterium GrIS 1.18]
MQTTDLRIFLAVAATGGLSAAGRHLNLAVMQVSRRIAALEEELGVRLFHRTTRSMSLTAEGEALLPYAHTISDADDNALNELRPQSARVSGTLRLTAPTVFGQSIVIPLLPALLQQHPLMSVDLHLSDQIVDIVGLGLDLAIRVATLGDSELVARKIAPNPWVICAAPRYLDFHGSPATLAELEHHQCVLLRPVLKWPLMIDGHLQKRQLGGRVTANSVEAVRTAAVQGLGLAMLGYWDVVGELASGALVRIELEDALMDDLSVWAVTPTRRYVPARVKVFLDALEQALKKD